MVTRWEGLHARFFIWSMPRDRRSVAGGSATMPVLSDTDTFTGNARCSRGAGNAGDVTRIGTLMAGDEHGVLDGAAMGPSLFERPAASWAVRGTRR